MEYKKVVGDFAYRTRQNLAFIDNAKKSESGAVYEFTQLVNSLLGLLVFPKEQYLSQIPATPLPALVAQGWLPIRITLGKENCKDLRQLITFMRHGIAHFNIEFETDGSEVTGLKIWNYPGGRKENGKNWEAYFSEAELRNFTSQFIDTLEKHGTFDG